MLEDEARENFFSSPIIVLSDATKPDDPRVREICERLESIRWAITQLIPAVGSPIEIYHRGAIIRGDRIEDFLITAERVAQPGSLTSA